MSLERETQILEALQGVQGICHTIKFFFRYSEITLVRLRAWLQLHGVVTTGEGPSLPPQGTPKVQFEVCRQHR